MATSRQTSCTRFHFRIAPHPTVWTSKEGTLTGQRRRSRLFNRLHTLNKQDGVSEGEQFDESQPMPDGAQMPIWWLPSHEPNKPDWRCLYFFARFCRLGSNVTFLQARVQRGHKTVSCRINVYLYDSSLAKSANV